MSGGQNLADDVEHGVVVERLANLVELFQQLVQDAALDSIGRDEIENQAVVQSGRSGVCGPSAARAGWDSTECRS